MSLATCTSSVLPGLEPEFDPRFQQDPNKTFDIRLVNSEPGAIGRSKEETAAVLDQSNTVGRYELICEVGRGGMGEVHSCSDSELRREVVVKILHGKFLIRSDMMARFQAEIRITCRLEHPGVVPIYEAGIMPDGRPYFVMQRVSGSTLRSIMEERHSTGNDRARLLKIFEQTCQTVAYAHTQRIIHRDLNPSNIMVGTCGQVKVMDWGLAKSLDTDTCTDNVTSQQEPETGEPTEPTDIFHTQFGSVMGTLAYMPPEQARGDILHLDERCDVFALGAILCEILTGSPPYLSKKPLSLLRSAMAVDLDGAFTRLDQSRAEPCLIRLAKSCMAEDLDQRPRNAGVVLNLLGDYFEMALRQAEWDLVRFFDLSLDLFCIAGLDGYFRRVNDNFSRVLGFSSIELTASPFLEFVHPDDRGTTIEVVGELSRGIPIVRFRNRYRNRQGLYRWFEWAAKSIPSDDVIFAAARDVTDEMDLIERLQQFERLHESPKDSAVDYWSI